MESQAEEQLNKLINAYNSRLDSEEEQESEMMRLSSMEIDAFEEKHKKKSASKIDLNAKKVEKVNPLKKVAKNVNQEIVKKDVQFERQLETTFQAKNPIDPISSLAPMSFGKKKNQFASQIDDLEFDDFKVPTFEQNILFQEDSDFNMQEINQLSKTSDVLEKSSGMLEEQENYSQVETTSNADHLLLIAQKNERIEQLLAKINDLEKNTGVYHKILSKEFGSFECIQDLLNKHQNLTKKRSEEKNQKTQKPINQKSESFIEFDQKATFVDKKYSE